MKLLLSIFITLSVSVVFSQHLSVKEEINRDVWLPFIESYNSMDSEAFIAIHTEDVIRISRDGSSIRIGEEYSRSVREGNDRSRNAGRSRTIDFRFLERFATGQHAFEVGYYKVTNIYAERDPAVFYGKFHVILKKIGGKWKLFVDADTSMDNLITEDLFLTGEPIN